MLYEVITPWLSLGFWQFDQQEVPPSIRHHHLSDPALLSMLDFSPASQIRTFGSGGFRSVVPFCSVLLQVVITSYSIHYTKLYELSDSLPWDRSGWQATNRDPTPDAKDDIRRRGKIPRKLYEFLHRQQGCNRSYLWWSEWQACMWNNQSCFSWPRCDWY